MKLLMYGWEFPPNINGGLGVACYGIAKGLLNHPIQLSLILPTAQYESIIPEEAHRLDAIAPVTKNDRILQPYLVNSGLKNEDRDYQLLEEVIAYANSASLYATKIPHDIIYAHDWLAALAGIEAKKLSGKPLVVHFHSIEKDRCGDYFNQTIYNIEQLALKVADQIIAVSHYTKKMICQTYAVSPNKISVVHNGIFPKQINTTPKPIKYRNYILFIGRITYQKGPYYFIEAAEKLLKIRDDVEFIIVGNGDQRSWLMHYVAKKRLTNRIHFTGFLDQNALIKIFALAKVYVLSSVTEPFGLSCLEALANQVPVIVAKQSGVREVLPHLLSFDFWDTNELANRMNALLFYPHLAKEELKATNKILPQLTWGNAGKKIHEICHKLIGETH